MLILYSSEASTEDGDFPTVATADDLEDNGATPRVPRVTVIGSSPFEL